MANEATADDGDNQRDDVAPLTYTHMKLTRDELLPSAQRAYDALVLSSGEISTIILSDQLAEKEKMVLSRDGSGKPRFIVSEREHRWTEEWADKQVLSDQDLSALKPYQHPEVLAALTAMCEKLGIHPVPPIFDVKVEELGSQGGAGITREGTNFLAVNGQLDPHEIMDILAHEIGHIKHSDHTAAAQIAAHNDESGEIHRAQERQADATAAMLGRGPSLAAYIERQLANPQIIVKANALGVTPNEFARINDPEHPAPLDRSQYLQQVQPAVQAELMAQPEQRFAGDNPLANLVHPADIIAFRPLAGGEHIQEQAAPDAVGQKPSTGATIKP